jgi:hypothetical protein
VEWLSARSNSNFIPDRVTANRLTVVRLAEPRVFGWVQGSAVGSTVGDSEASYR